MSILEARVAECDVLLALIGRGWLTATDEAGRRRLDNAEDFVRIEIATALTQGKRVIPVLIDDVPMPRSEDMPEVLKPLVWRQAARLSHDRFKADSARLIRALKQVLAEAETVRREDRQQAEVAPSPAPDVKRLGGELARRPLHFFWIVDCSDSMQGEKIAALNYAIRNALPEVQKAAASNPNVQVLVRAIRFSDSAQWHIAQPIEVENFIWTDLQAHGATSMGKALSLLAQQLKTPPMPERALPPVLVLLSGGKPTDDFNGGLKALMAEPWGKKSVRLAIAIGQDADEEVLQRFIGHPEIRPLQANDSEDLVKFIKWGSVVVSSAASQPVGLGPIPEPVPIPTPPPATADDVW